MNVISSIVRWLLVALVLVFGLFAVFVAYVMHVAGVMQQHKQQADPAPTDDGIPAMLSSGAGQPAIRINRVEFNDAHNTWLNKKG